MTNPIPEKYRDLAACGAILLAVVVFFADALFTGKNFLSEGDNVAFYSFIPYLKAAKAAGEFPLWVPYIFSGMPSLASFLAAGERSWDILSQLIFSIPVFLGDVFGNDTARLGMWYTIYGWGIYTLMRVKKHSRLVGIFAGTSAIFATFVITWIMIGHSTKPVSLATLPWILLALERLREKFSFLNVFLLTVAMIALVSATHPQMMFYMGCAAGIYLITELATRLVKKDGAIDVLKAGGALVVATIIALGTHADMFLATREYTPLSTRGSAPIVQVEGAQQQDQTGGNDYEYATNWSFSPGEMMTFMVPNYYGFGNTKVKQGAREQRTNLYWGQMPFTDAANYMGIGILMLGIFGAWANRRDPFVIFLIALSLFSLLLSFGKNFSVLYDLVYHHIPAFNKFRAPSMALCLLQFAMPVLAGYGVSTLIGWTGNKDRRKIGNVLAGTAVAFLLIGVAYTSVNEASYKEAVANALVEKNPGQLRSAADVSPQYLDMVYDEMRSDWITIGIFAVGFGLIGFLMIRGTLKPVMATTLFIALSLTDLWRVDARPYEPKKGSPEQNVFRKTDAVDFLQQDKSAFRIVDLTGGRLPANWWAYHFIENVHGYSSAKIRVYQDMLDVAGPGKGREPVPGNSMIVNPFLWDLLNVKYIVSDRPVFQGIQPTFQSATGLLVYQNMTALPRAWFVDTVKVEADRRKTLEMLRDGTFNPRTTAYVEANLNKIVAGDSTATVRITGKSNQKLTFATKTSSDAFLVVSEVFYPEWQCTIDGKPVETAKTNFLLRGIVVPSGDHTVEFTFSSPAFEQGRTISMASNGAAILIGLAGFFVWFRQRKQSVQA